ncbi:ParB like nuclease/partitioning protein [Thermus phage G20c]|nr:ParB like nuclease/partitioning protein [Thermus phage G20c]
MMVELKQVPLTDIQPNPWNPHRMTEEEFEALIASVREDGQWRPIIVVEMDVPDEYTPKVEFPYRIVDGEHLYRALVQLHMEGVWPNLANVVVYGKNSEVPVWKQMEIGQTINHGLRGSKEDPVKTKQVLDQILKHRPVEAVARKLGMGVAGVKRVAEAPKPVRLSGPSYMPTYKERQNHVIALLFSTADELKEFDDLVQSLATPEERKLPRGQRRLSVLKRALQALKT